MGGFSDNYECGYWDEVPNPLLNKKKVHKHTNMIPPYAHKHYKENSDLVYRYLYILLTPIALLDSHGQDTRINLFNTCNTETVLELSYDDTQKNISFYYDEICIGGIQKVFEENKIDNTEIVNNFCFIKNEYKPLEAFWDGERIYLRSCV